MGWSRRWRWRKLLDTGVYATLEEPTKAKGMAPSYVSRVLRLTLLAPEIVEAILEGRQPAELQLDDLLEGSPWSGRRNRVAPSRNAFDRSDMSRKRKLFRRTKPFRCADLVPRLCPCRSTYL